MASKKKVYLSPSDQTNNAYAYGNTNEAVQCRKISNAVETALERTGAFSVKNNKTDSMADRVKESNEWKADIHVCLHTNAFNKKTKGTRIFCYSKTGEGYEAALAVYKVLAPLTPGESENVTVNASLYEVKNSNAPCVYIEVDFHDVESVAKWIIEHTTEIGEAIAEGLCNYFGIKYIKPSATATQKTTTTKETTTVKEVIPKKVKSKVVTASIKAKGKNYKVTDHFTLGEFQCRNGADAVKYDMQTVTALEAARLFFNVPITISSAYRPASYNKKIGSATKSYHVYGKAVDHYCKLSYTLLAKFYEVYGLKGIGCYYDDHFVHIDSRATKFYWKNQTSTKVSTHLITVKSGSNNQHVKDLQWLLKNKHGYSLTIDGDFGAKTLEAVKDFQKKHGLTVDGIVGAKTWKKLLAI